MCDGWGVAALQPAPFIPAAPAEITAVRATAQPTIWDQLGTRGLDLGEDFIRKLLGLGTPGATPAGTAQLEVMLAEQRRSQQTLILVGGGLVAAVVLVMLLRAK